MTSKLRELVAEFQRRHVFRTGAIYAVAAWGLTQVAATVFPAFSVDDTWLRALIVAAFAGFPIVLVLAWVFEVSPKGISVTDDDDDPRTPLRRNWWIRPLIATPIVAGVVGGTVWLWTARLADTGATEFTRKTRPDELPVVAVLPLENLTGRKELEWAGSGVASLIRDDLARSRYLVVVSEARTIRLVKAAADIDELFNAALDAGVTHVLSGEILRAPDGMTVTSRLTDLRRNVEVGANRAQALEPERLMSVATAITSLIKQGLGVPGTEKVDVFATDFATDNPAAYEAFIVGMQNFLNFDYASAKSLFEVAVQKAPDFAMARYRLAHSLASLGDTTTALEQIKQARSDGLRLSSREQAYMAAAESFFARDYPAAAQKYRAILEEYPYESEARTLLVYVLYNQGSYDEALVEAERLATQDPGDETAWSSAADLHSKLGNDAEADKAIARLLQISPQNPNAHFLAGESQFYRGQFDTATTHFGETLRLDPTFGDAVQRLALIDVLQGRPAAALDRLLAMSNDEAFGLGHRTTAAIDAAHVLRAEGRPGEADALLASHADDFNAEQITVALALALRSRSLLDLGRTQEALSLAQASLASSMGRPTRYLHARGLAELAAGDAAAVGRTVGEIRALPTVEGSGDRTDVKAADHLAGLAALAAGDSAAAVASLQSAIEGEGREFGLYRLSLARALAAAGKAPQAREAAAAAADRGDLRRFGLEFEADRREAARLAAELRK